MKLFAKQSSSGDGRVFRSGVWSAALAAAVIVLAVLVNLIVRAIPSRYTEFDLSEAGLYTLSESSRQVADDLTQDVTIYYLAQTGNEDQIISKLLDKYAAQSSHITWELKDPAVYPTFAAQYGAQVSDLRWADPGLRGTEQGAGCRRALRLRLQRLCHHRRGQRDL